MAHLEPDNHGSDLLLARSEVGSVSLCACGVVTGTLQYLSVRFEPAACRELQALLTQARIRIDGNATSALASLTAPDEAPPVH